MADDKKGARSYKSEVIGDSMAITINFKWLLQLIIFVGMVVYAFCRMESRIVDLERNMVLALEEIELHDQERQQAEQKHIESMQEQMDWYQQELNLNPFSWGKKSKNK